MQVIAPIPSLAPTFEHNEYVTDGIGLYRVVPPLELARDGVAELEDCFTLRLAVLSAEALEEMELTHVR